MNLYSPIQKTPTVPDTGTSIDFGILMGAITMLNTGAADCWFTFDGNPSASDGDGRTRLVAGGPGFSIDNSKFRTVGFITASGTAVVQCVATAINQ